MKKKSCILINLSLMMGTFLMLASSCSKSNDSNNPTSSGSTVTDIDGNVYHTVAINTQVWMVENLKTTKYRNGDLIGTTTPVNLDYLGQNTPKYQWAVGGNESNVSTYGRLYTWFAATDSRNICPIGWHLPSDSEWTTLTTFLGGENVAGGKLKEIGTIHWKSPNTGATNESGFTALPGDYHWPGDNLFTNDGNCSFYWSSTPSYGGSHLNNAWYWFRYIPFDGSYVNRSEGGESAAGNSGFSVRCIKD
jgi:uncharacterized protein (TIGR02145 family)